jgi:transcriptional regulator with XRE-family HTH domain
MTPAQLRMARAAVKLGVRELAELAGVATYTISRFETEQGGLRHDTAQKIEAVLARLGVRFTTDAEGRACICYRAES